MLEHSTTFSSNRKCGACFAWTSGNARDRDREDEERPNSKPDERRDPVLSKRLDVDSDEEDMDDAETDAEADAGTTIAERWGITSFLP